MVSVGEREFGLWIDGASRAAASGDTFARTGPYDGSVVARYANADEADADAAIAAARRSFDDGRWRDTSARFRRDVLAKTAERVVAESEQVAHLIALEVGKPIAQARGEVLHAAQAFAYYAGAVLDDAGEAISERAPGALGLVYHEPIGVAAMITAWNFPMLQICSKVAAALGAGCSVVAKPSHLCSSSALLLAEILQEAGLPAGVLNVVTSDIERGALVGQRLAQANEVDIVSFTGSTAAGSAVMRAASSNLKRVQLELGGKSANIVFADADLDEAAAAAAAAFTVFSGQQCSAGSRLLVERSIHREFVDSVVKILGNNVFGDPLDPGTTMGPLISPEQFRRVMDYVDTAEAPARLVAGGVQPVVDAPVNLFLEPAVFDDVPRDSRLAQEEVFGPVLAVIPFDTEEEAVSIANDSDFGLAGAVWTASIDRALRVTKAVRTGRITVNCYGGAGIGDMPHGGYKRSGLGRENSRAGLREYQELKSIQIKIATPSGNDSGRPADQLRG